MSKKNSRRQFLKAGIAVSTGLAASNAVADDDPLITQKQTWNQELGSGVDERPYGMPSKIDYYDLL